MDLLISDVFRRARSDPSSASVGGCISNLLVEEYDEEGVWQQLELANKKFANGVERGDIRKEFSLLVNEASKQSESEEEEEIEEDGGPESDVEEVEDEVNDEGDGDQEDADAQFQPRGKDVAEVDGLNDGFFSLSEMEAFLEKADMQEKQDGGDDDEDEEDDDDDDGDDDNKENEMHDDAEDDGDDDEQEQMDDDFDEEDDDGDGDSDNDNDEGEEGTNDEVSAVDLKKMSGHERRQYKVREEITGMEEANLAPKSWDMSGETSGHARPENSLLQELLQVDQVQRSAPESTSEKMRTIEDMIIQRIKDQAWDDVVRKEKPAEKAYEYRKAASLDQEKSKLSLAQVYEKEYLNQVQKDAPKQESEEVRDIRRRAKLLFASLDALCNYHYTPKAPTEDIKIVTNRPAIELEEVIPAATSDATLLAPNEVMAAQKREAKGATERTDTDRKRERRSKKATQRQRAVREKKKLKTGGKTAAAIDHVKKQAKLGKVTIVGKGQTDKAIKSSTAFFSKLQDQATVAVAKARASASA